jgi:CheY-like chemotaxis protein
MTKGKPVKVLVVDDDRSHRFMLSSMFSEWGWNVEEADDGTTAVAAVEEHFYDAILSVWQKWTAWRLYGEFMPLTRLSRLS